MENYDNNVDQINKIDIIKSYSFNRTYECSFTCRICQVGLEDDQDMLISPCSCIGSLEYAHPSCLLEWVITRESKKENLDADLMSQDLTQNPDDGSIGVETLSFLKQSLCELCNNYYQLKCEGRTVCRNPPLINYKNNVRLGFLTFYILIAALNGQLAQTRIQYMDVTFQLMCGIAIVFTFFSIQMSWVCIKMIFLDTSYFLLKVEFEKNKTQPVENEIHNNKEEFKQSSPFIDNHEVDQNENFNSIQEMPSGMPTINRIHHMNQSKVKYRSFLNDQGNTQTPRTIQKQLVKTQSCNTFQKTMPNDFYQNQYQNRISKTEVYNGNPEIKSDYNMSPNFSNLAQKKTFENESFETDMMKNTQQMKVEISPMISNLKQFGTPENEIEVNELSSNEISKFKKRSAQNTPMMTNPKKSIADPDDEILNKMTNYKYENEDE